LTVSLSTSYYDWNVGRIDGFNGSSVSLFNQFSRSGIFYLARFKSSTAIVASTQVFNISDPEISRTSSTSTLTGSTSAPSSSPTASLPSASSGLTVGAKIGVGVGVGLGFPLLTALLAAVFLLSRRKNRVSTEKTNNRKASAETTQLRPEYKHELPTLAPDTITAKHETPTPKHNLVSEIDGSPVLHELPNSVAHELPSDSHR